MWYADEREHCKVYAVDWSPDGEKVASGGKDRVLKLWMNWPQSKLHATDWSLGTR
jgi:WD40 repeat protein